MTLKATRGNYWLTKVNSFQWHQEQP
jgi:hypothetical protein